MEAPSQLWQVLATTMMIIDWGEEKVMRIRNQKRLQKNRFSNRLHKKGNIDDDGDQKVKKKTNYE